MNTSIKAGHVDVWFCYTESAELQPHLGAYEDMLSAAEKEQYEQFPQKAQRQDYLVSRALLRTVLSRYCEFPPERLEFGVNDFGKPELCDPMDRNIQFNTAHTHGLTVCVVTRDAPVGIDAEFHSDSQSLLKVADDYFSPLELHSLNSLSDEASKLQYFFRYWTLKEAYIKARGEGLSIPLHDFSVVLEENGEFKEFQGPDARSWDFKLLMQDNRYTAGLAMGGHIDSLAIFKCIPLGKVTPLDKGALFS